MYLPRSLLTMSKLYFTGSSVFVGHKEEMVESKEIVEKMPIDIVSPILAIR